MGHKNDKNPMKHYDNQVLSSRQIWLKLNFKLLPTKMCIVLNS